MLRANQIEADRAFVLVIDLQQKLLPAIRHRERVVASATKLLDGGRVFALPVLATEQYPKGLGSTDPTVREAADRCGARWLEKPTFSACDEPAVKEAIVSLDRTQVVVVGIEAHICVQQTVLDLIAMDYDVFVCADGIGSRSKLDYRMSLDRMRQEDAQVTTVESVLFELCQRCDTARFKAMLEVIKAAPPATGE